jgi:hypothetical protein
MEMTDLLTSGDAAISNCGQYRYQLRRTWSSGPECTFIMLNPSTADASEDDPTIRRCISFAKRERCGSLLVVNLFAFRATKPEDMAKAIDPAGPENPRYLDDALKNETAIAAWGAHWMAERAGKSLAQKYNLLCLGKTKSGAPRHPLYVKGDAPLISLNQADTQ